MHNPIDISATLKGLIPYQKYNFVFDSVAANWPTVINPVSGSFTASSSSGTVDATVYFCPSKDACNNCDGLLSYQDCLCDIGDNYFTKIQMSFSLDQDPSKSFKSDSIKVVCSGCLPKAQIVSNSGLALTTNNKFPIHYIFDNLKPYKTYAYNVEAINSDWPFYLSSISGLITSSGVRDVVETFGGFCATTGECPNNTKGVVPYTMSVGGVNCAANSWTLPQTSLRLVLTDPDCPTVTYHSNILRLNCSDCGRRHVSVSVETNDLTNC